MENTSFDVLIVGGGPCGLMLALELGRRGVHTLLVNEQPDTAFNPQANATQARTMEHFRRLGFADEVRALGLPPDFPTDIAYCTRYAGHELARFRLPSAKDAKKAAAAGTGSWSAAELPHRVSQKFVEKLLREKVGALPSVTLRYGWRLTQFEDNGAHVAATIAPAEGGPPVQVQANYLVGADGPRSFVRQTMGWSLTGESGVQRDFMGGRMYAMYIKAPTFYDVSAHPPAWMNVTFNRDRRAFMAAVDGVESFAFHTQLKPHEREDAISESDAKAMFCEAVGRDMPLEILSRRTWTAGHCLVANQFQKGRVFIAGDAAHLFTPTGGLGYNTAVEDAVNLGWKLAAVLGGYAAPRLLTSYERERQPAAIRNTGYARGFADSLGLFSTVAEIEDESPAGAKAREEAGAYLAAHGRAEFNIPGVTFGTRYDGSPAIVPDGTTPPQDAANTYEPSATPGGRAPHYWLAAGQSLYDAFGFDWTLLHFGLDAHDVSEWRIAAEQRGLPLQVCHVADADIRAGYGCDWALIRPDQVVAARGSSAAEPRRYMQALLGS